ncbi:MAG: hypothetical protein GTO45_28960 [Candidatus Aminicenantes bacterium]|nr:hypothetical protein [Candidatus Aminicenantes bacterium]NIM82822.1 hypothetical protein [Candidatus Aminicenantes bacterium]NIN22198.1 hypothetical protein [Candidatus Aminicenantes bacterium]NIN45966.1 hypothetical protein [Candidatus Aminicenantes bacterium]NIN88802.1 hypothetical protein [Candidatus Aminicenantes bacterium]
MKKKSLRNLKKYFGILKPSGDALEFQKKMRAEWDERELREEKKIRQSEESRQYEVGSKQ